MSYLRSALLAILISPFVQLVQASAAAQYQLTFSTDVSSMFPALHGYNEAMQVIGSSGWELTRAECWVQCHAITVGLLSAAYYQANEQELTRWCKNEVRL